MISGEGVCNCTRVSAQSSSLARSSAEANSFEHSTHVEDRFMGDRILAPRKIRVLMDVRPAGGGVHSAACGRSGALQVDQAASYNRSYAARIRRT